MTSVVNFPTRTVRAWVIHPHNETDWIGDLVGGRDLADDGPSKTEAGAFGLVMTALTAREVRQGLPIVVVDFSKDYRGAAA